MVIKVGILNSSTSYHYHINVSSKRISETDKVKKASFLYHRI